jgi:5-methylcytosine-specific restriction endonuclease McrA
MNQTEFYLNVQELNKKFAVIEQQENSIVLWKYEILKAIYDESNLELAREFANEIYWDERLSMISDLKNMWEIKTGEKFIQKPKKVTVICTKCIAEFEISAKSVSDAHKPKLCPECTPVNNPVSGRDLLAEANKKYWKEYQERLYVLKTMPYREYLKTPEWQERRKAAYRRAQNRCQLCNNTGVLNVHHRDYTRRGNELNSDLIVLCDKCHKKFHGIMEVSE